MNVKKDVIFFNIPFPIVPLPSRYKTLSKWLFQISSDNKIDIIILLETLSKFRTKNSSSLIEATSQLTGINKTKLLNLKVDFFEYFNFDLLYCPFFGCKEKFEDKNRLRLHFNRNHSFKLEQEKCIFCGKAFNELRGIRRHLRSIHLHEV